MSKAMFLSTIPRVLLGIIFLIFGIDGFVYVFTGSSLIVPPVSEAGGQFIASLQASGFFWPFMKTIYIVAALCLLTNRAPALGIALLIPIIAVIILFQFLTLRASRSRSFLLSWAGWSFSPTATSSQVFCNPL